MGDTGLNGSAESVHIGHLPGRWIECDRDAMLDTAVRALLAVVPRATDSVDQLARQVFAGSVVTCLLPLRATVATMGAGRDIDRLEARGLIEPAVGNRDRRFKAMRLTPAGVATRSRILATFAEGSPFAHLSADEQRHLPELLARIRERSPAR